MFVLQVYMKRNFCKPLNVPGSNLYRFTTGPAELFSNVCLLANVGIVALQ
jgi:hypothetical protein